MKEIRVKTPNSITKSDIRLIGFASDKILSYEIEESEIVLHLTENVSVDEEGKIVNNLKMILNFEEGHSEGEIFKNYKEKEYYDNQSILQNKIINQYGDGLISLSSVGIELLNFFDSYFKNILRDYDYEEKQFPTLLPLGTIESTSYFDTSPQYINFCSNTKESIDTYKQLRSKYSNNEINSILDEPANVLSPSACFHLFGDLRDKTVPNNSIYTLRQKVFRNEGRFNWNELSRLRDYTVREIVMIGDHNYIVNMRQILLERTTELLIDLDMNFKVVNASDPFIMPEMQMYKKLQAKSHLKYEIQVYSSRDNCISCASFNLHSTSFSKKFGFNCNSIPVTESGCIGFGLERLIIAFLNQYGVDIVKWPAIVKNKITKNLKKEKVLEYYI